MTSIDAITAEPAQLALEFPTPARRTPRPHRARTQQLSWSEWVRRDAQLHAALEDARELGDEREIERAHQDWKQHMREIPRSTRRRRR